MRWLPLPTCRLPLRRFIASLTIAALVLPMFGAPVAYADGMAEEMAPPVTGGAGAAPANTSENKTGGNNNGNAFCEGFSYPETDNAKAKDQDRYKRWVSEYQKRSEEHLRKSPAVGADSIRAVLDQSKVEVSKRIGYSVHYHQEFFDSIARFADELCPHVLNFSNNVTKVQKAVEAAKAKQTSETCSFDSAKEISNGSQQELSKINTIYGEYHRLLTNAYGKWAQQNKQAVETEDHAEDSVPPGSPQKQPAMSRVSKLGIEVQRIWGTDAEIKTVAEGKVADKNPEGLFAQILQTINVQKSILNNRVNALSVYTGEFKSLDNKCGSITKTFLESGKEKGKLTAKPNDTNNIIFDKDGTAICKPGTSAVINAGRVDPSHCETTVARNFTGGGNVTGGGNTNDTGAGDPPPPSPPPSPTPPPAKTEEEESWFSKNKTPLIIGGVGVAAVAGALYWKKTEDDKSKDKAKNMELEAMAAAQTQQQQAAASSSSSGSSTSTDSTYGGISAANQTTVGSTLMIEGTPSGSVPANSTLPPLTIKVVDPNGIMTTDSSTDITVSCASATPSPCTLSGTLTVNTDKGSAVFSDLKFSGSHTNVTLLFSAGGFTPVKSGNFDVTARQ